MFRFILILFLLTLTAPVHATVSSTTSRMDYTGNGAVDTYSYSYKIFANTDLLVTVKDTDDVETTLTLTTDYTVTGVGRASGGNVVLVNSSQDWLDGDGDLLAGYVLTIRRVRPIKQLTDIRNQGAFYPEVHEDTFDILTMIAQQQQDELDRSMKLSETSDPDDFSTIMPSSLIGNPGASIIVNDSGNGFTDGPNADAIADAQANAVSAAADAAQAAIDAVAAQAAAASVNLPSFTGNSLKILQTNQAANAWQMMDLRAPNVGIGTTTPNAGKFTTLETTTTFKSGTTHQGDILYDNGTSLVRLTPGTSGQYLKTQGSSANPTWSTVNVSTIATGTPDGTKYIRDDGTLQPISFGMDAGTVSDGGTIPLPSGYIQSECVWTVSIGSTSPSGSHPDGVYHNATVNGSRVATCTTTSINPSGGGSVGTTTCNYMIICHH